MPFIQNTSHGNLSLRGGALRIPRGAFLEVATAEVDHPDVFDAKRKGWVKVTEDAPSVVVVPAVPAIEIEDTAKYTVEGMTEDQLKAELAGEAAPVQEPAAAEEAPAETKKTKKAKAA